MTPTLLVARTADITVGRGASEDEPAVRRIRDDRRRADVLARRALLRGLLDEVAAGSAVGHHADRPPAVDTPGVHASVSSADGVVAAVCAPVPVAVDVVDPSAAALPAAVRTLDERFAGLAPEVAWAVHEALLKLPQTGRAAGHDVRVTTVLDRVVAVAGVPTSVEVASPSGAGRWRTVTLR